MGRVDGLVGQARFSLRGQIGRAGPVELTGHAGPWGCPTLFFLLLAWFLSPRLPTLIKAKSSITQMPQKRKKEISALFYSIHLNWSILFYKLISSIVSSWCWGGRLYIYKKKKKTLTYSNKEIRKLISYPNFSPFCHCSRILTQISKWTIRFTNKINIKYTPQPQAFHGCFTLASLYPIIELRLEGTRTL